MISKQFMKGRYIFQALFFYYSILKYSHCSSVLHLLKIVPKTFTNVFVPQVAWVHLDFHYIRSTLFSGFLGWEDGFVLVCFLNHIRYNNLNKIGKS